MSYVKGSSASKEIVVEQPYELSLKVSNQLPVAGETIKWQGTITPSPGLGAKIGLYAYIPDRWVLVATATVGMEGPTGGIFSGSWTVPHRIEGVKISGSRTMLIARYGDYESNGVGLVVYMPSRISITAPSNVKVGEVFTVSGKLEYEYDSGDWRGLANKVVEIYVDESKVGEVTTGSDGSYSIDMKINEPGVHVLKVVFGGVAGSIATTSSRYAVRATGEVTIPIGAIVVGSLIALGAGYLLVRG